MRAAQDISTNVHRAIVRPDRPRLEVLSNRSEADLARRLLLVSNRLPFAAEQENGDYWLRPTNGGLANALRRIHAKANSLWVGSIDSAVPACDREAQLRDRFAAARLVPIALSDDEVAAYYRHYANGVLWPALHGLSPRSKADAWSWGMYQSVNERFAKAVVTEWREGDRIWVHDYQLMLLPAMLRARLPDAEIGFFLHTPFPQRHVTALAAWPQLAAGMLGADIVGLQTRRDADAFEDAIAVNLRASERHAFAAKPDRRLGRVVAAPIAIDHAWFAERASHPAVLDQCASMRASCPGPLFVGVDRLDYTKGIPERLIAFQRLLDFEPQLRGRACFVQVGVPSRDGVEGYGEIRERVERIVAEINGTYGTASWTPVKFRCESIDANTLVALYRAANVMVVTPKRDGMNLVAKEFVASRTDGGGVLVLSRRAGAAEELRAALQIDPDDVGSITAAYRRALRMSVAERRARMSRLRARVRRTDVLKWADHFVNARGRDAAMGVRDV